MNYKEEIKVFKALTDANRLEILRILTCDKMCNGELLKRLSICQSTLSHHMKILVEAKLVRELKQGKYIFYNLDKRGFDLIDETLNILKNFKLSSPIDFNEDLKND